MIYIKNNRETQTVYIPRTELNAESYVAVTNSYEDGYRDGKVEGQKIQKAKLTGLVVSDNGLYERGDGWNKVEVNVAGGEFKAQEKTVTVSMEKEDVYPDKGYDGLSAVHIDAVQFKEEAYNDGYDHGYEEGKAGGGSITNVAEEGLKFGYSTFVETPKHLDFKGVKSMDYMFAFCIELETVNWMDTSNVTTMMHAFTECFKLKNFPEIDTSNVTNMYNAFAYCKSLENIPLLNTSNVTSMNKMFHNCDSLREIPLFDTSSVKDMSYAFSYCDSLTTIPKLDTSNATKMTAMFYNTSNLTSLPEIDATNATDLSYFFGDNEMTNLTSFGGFKNLKTSIADDYCLAKAPNLDLQSLASIANNVYNFTANNETPAKGQGVLKLHPDVYDKIANMIGTITRKGWTIIS